MAEELVRELMEELALLGRGQVERGEAEEEEEEEDDCKRPRLRSSISEGMSFMKKSGGKMSESSRSLTSIGSNGSIAEEGPITDIQVLFRGQKCPAGYTKVSALTPTKPQTGELNKGHAGRSVQVCFKRGGSAAPITGVVLIHEGKEEFVPPGYEILGSQVSGQFMADIAMGMGLSGRVFLCICRGEGPPVEDICIIPANARELLPEGFGVLERTPLGFSALINPRSKQHACYLCIKRSTTHLDLFSRLVSTTGVLERFPLFRSKTFPLQGPMLSKTNGVDTEACTKLLQDMECSLFPSSSKSWSGCGSFRAILKYDDLREVPEMALLSCYLVLLACHSYNIPCMILALNHLERFIRGGHFDFSLDTSTDLRVHDLLCKTAADVTELGLDVLFAPAMHVLTAFVEKCHGGVHPVSVHAMTKAMTRTTCFFRMLPMRLYTSASQHRREYSHRFTVSFRGGDDSYPLSMTSSFSSISNSSDNLDGTDAKTKMTPEQAIEKLSFLTLEDLNFLLRCPVLLFDVFANRAAKAEEGVDLDQSATPEKHEEDCSEDAASVVSSILHDIVEDAVSLKVKMQVTTDAAKLLASHTTESASFGRDIHRLLCKKLRLSRPQENVVMILVWLSQSCSMRLNKPLRKGRLFNAELNQKSTSLQLLKELLASTGSAGGSFHSSMVFGYQLRLFTFPAVLVNLGDQRRIELALPVLSELWKNSRKHLRLELGVCLDKVLLAILNEKLCPPSLRRDLLDVLVSWFGMHPGDLVELFLNFESDPVLWNGRSFERLISTLCHLTDPSSYLMDTEPDSSAIIKEIQYESLSSLVTLLRALTDMSGTLRLMASDEKLRERSTTSGADGLGWDVENTSATNATGSVATVIVNKGGKHSSVRLRHVARSSADSTLEEAFRLAHSKGVRKSLGLLVEAGVVQETPEEIACFLHTFHRDLGEKNVGAYLGSRPTNDPFMNQVRLDFTSALNFAGKSFEQCLRLFLEQGHFFLPGESQQVEALLEAFATCFVDANKAEFSREDSDMIMVLAYSTVMLNTDLHNPAVNKKKKMTEEQFLRQISFIENGSRISAEFGAQLYRSIASREIKMASSTSSLASEALGTRATPTSLKSLPLGFSASASGGIMGPSASDESFKGLERDDMPLMGASMGGCSSQDIEFATPESSASMRHTLSTLKSNGDSTLTRVKATQLFFLKLIDGIAHSRTIISAMNGMWHVYHTKVTSDSVRVMFEVSWSHFYSLVTKILENPRVFSLDVVSLALDVLSHSISISLFLGMETERRAFATLLAKFHYLYTTSAEACSNVDLVKGEHLKDKWYHDVMQASCFSENVIDVISEVHHLTASMKERIARRQNNETLLSIQKRFDGSIELMEPGREFIREGPLLKRCRNNKYRKYHFFLFSDLLIYASQRTLSGSKFHAHQLLPLHTMQVRETEGSKAFEVRHPRKSFVVQAASEEEKYEWMRDIRREVETLYQKQLSVTLAPNHFSSTLPMTGNSSGKEGGSFNLASSSSSSGSSSMSSSASLKEIPTGKKRAVSMAITESCKRHLTPPDAVSDTEGDIDDDEEEDLIQDPKAFECDMYDDDEDDIDHEDKDLKGGEKAEVEDVQVSGLETCSADSSNNDRAKQNGDTLEEEEEGEQGLKGIDSTMVASKTSHIPILESKQASIQQEDSKPENSSSSSNDNNKTKKPFNRRDPRFATLKVVSSKKNQPLHPSAPSQGPNLVQGTITEAKEEFPENEDQESKLEWLKTLDAKVGQVESSVLEMDVAELHKAFVVGLRFAKPILMSNHSKYQATDEQKLLIYGFFKQSTQGDCVSEKRPPMSDWVSYSKFRVWESLQGTSKSAAKRKFLTVLNRVAPGWSDRTALTA